MGAWQGEHGCLLSSTRAIDHFPPLKASSRMRACQGLGLVPSAEAVVCVVAARERVAELAAKSPKFSAIDRVIGRNGLKVVPVLLLL